MVATRALWWLKQLFPHTYWTVYGTEDGSERFCLWRMWLGRCYTVVDFQTGNAFVIERQIERAKRIRGR